MDPEIKVFKENVDAWIKKIRHDVAEFQILPQELNENRDNIQHNYELIFELKSQIEELRQEVNALKLIQIMSLKRLNMREREEVRSRINK